MVKSIRSSGRNEPLEPGLAATRAPGRGKSRPASATEHALALLARRDWTCREMLRKLASDGYPEQAAADAVAYLVEARYLDDRELALRFLEGASRTRGPDRLARELESRGVPRELVSELLAPARDSSAEADGALELAGELLRRQPGLSPRRLASRLASRGFSWDAVRAALARLGKNPEDDSES